MLSFLRRKPAPQRSTEGVAACDAIVAEARDTERLAAHTRDERARELEAAAEAEARERAALAAAEVAYDVDGGDPNARAVLRAREVVALAEVKRAAAQRRLDAATTTHANTAEALRRAEAEREEGRRAEYEAALRKRAALDAYEAVTAPHCAALLAAEHALREATRAIDAAYADANAAAAELRTRGYDVPDLDPMHRFAGIVRARALAPGFVGSDALDQVNRIRMWFGARSLETVILDPTGLATIDRSHAGMVATPERAPAERSDLELALRCRTFPEARDRITEERRRRARQLEAAASPPQEGGEPC